MAKNDILEICRKHLFENPSNKLPERTMERLVRIRKAYTHWCEFPMKSEVEIRDFLVSEGINRSMAYYDLEIIKVLLGNVKNAGKEWHRYRLIAMVEESYAMARDKLDVKAMALLIDKYGKYTQQHIPDHEQLPFDQVRNQPFEPTTDPTSLGILPDPEIDSKMKKMKENYAEDIDNNIQDVEFVEIMKDEPGE